MNKKSLIFILVVLAAVVFKYLGDNKDLKLDESGPQLEDADYIAPQEQLMKEPAGENTKNPTDIDSKALSADDARAIDTNIVEASSLVLEQVLKNNLAVVAKCLEIPSVQWPGSLKPTLSDMNQVLKQGMGEMVVYMDDWVETTVDLGNGTKRSIREEISYENPKNPSKYLIVYNLVEGSAPEVERLDADRSINPTPEYIDSFKVGAISASKEKGGRAIYENGNEMVVIEKDGIVESISISRKNKYITCSELNTIKGVCACQ